MSDTFEQRCVAAVAAVPHDAKCATNGIYGTPQYDDYRPCECSRDVRIGRGMAAACVEAAVWGDDEILAAFTAAAA